MPTDARARPFVELADALFAVERDTAGLSPADRLAVRKERSTPLVEHFACERDRLLDDPTVDARGPLSRALRYSRNHWEALTRFLTNGRIPLSNNDVEREIRHVAIGRRNWMHLGSDDAAEVACTWLSLIASARHAGLDSEEYLRDLCRVLPSWPRNRVLELAPMNWLATRARLLSKELEAPLGKITIPPPLSQSP